MSYVFLPAINVLFVGQYLLTNILKAALSDGKQAILLQTNHVQVHYLRLWLTPYNVLFLPAMNVLFEGRSTYAGPIVLDNITKSTCLLIE